ncbi:MAG TPA: sigma 54-interacting transcriptional regulator [Verrucomicrobiae bacterium]|nr:sigma 54-interacting transcriptional regulator [Verrucomicrobiae bacterium]
MTINVESQLKAVIESIGDGIYVTDTHGVCITCNEAFKRITGIDSDIVGKPVTYLLQHQFISEAVTLETLSTRRRITKVIKYPSGCEALVTGNPVFDEAKSLIGVVATVRDLTELNALRDELKQSKRLAAQYLKTIKNLNAPGRASLDRFIVRDPKMQRVLEVVSRVAESDATVMIYGESGVGKGLIAELIHEQSSRSRKGKFIKVDCGAIPSALLESELFGYERGAFTGARHEGKTGLFELAHGGTLFLDEIGELPLTLQVKLLTVLQDRRILRVGGTNPISIDVRILCATHRNLEKMVTEGSFRSDLFYRLNVIPVMVLPLRERKEDILVLTLSFLEKFCSKYNRSTSIAPEVLDCFLEYPWPGNVRELENTLERLVVLNQDGSIKIEEVPERIKIHFQPLVNKQAPPINKEVITLKHAVATAETEAIRLALQQSKTLAQAAESLGIDVSTLLRKSRKHGINRQMPE